MKLNIGDKVMVKARGDNNRHWSFGVNSEYVECIIEGEVHYAKDWDCDTVIAMGPHHRQHVPVSAIKPIKKSFRLKDGKKYETADGVVFKVTPWVYGNTWHVGIVHDEVWNDDGTPYYPDAPTLIRRHYTKPQPAHKLDLKKGDVVELVKWEDGACVYVGKPYKFDGRELKAQTPEGGTFFNVPSILPKGERPLFKVVSRV